MFNEYQSSKDAELRREEYVKEAETYLILGRLGHGRHASVRSIVALIIIAVVLTIVLL
jgi:hypothetical protein